MLLPILGSYGTDLGLDRNYFFIFVIPYSYPDRDKIMVEKMPLEFRAPLKMNYIARQDALRRVTLHHVAEYISPLKGLRFRGASFLPIFCP